MNYPIETYIVVKLVKRCSTSANIIWNKLQYLKPLSSYLLFQYNNNNNPIRTIGLLTYFRAFVNRNNFVRNCMRSKVSALCNQCTEEFFENIFLSLLVLPYNVSRSGAPYSQTTESVEKNRQYKTVVSQLGRTGQRNASGSRANKIFRYHCRFIRQWRVHYFWERERESVCVCVCFLDRRM